MIPMFRTARLPEDSAGGILDNGVHVLEHKRQHPSVWGVVTKWVKKTKKNSVLRRI